MSRLRRQRSFEQRRGTCDSGRQMFVRTFMVKMLFSFRYNCSYGVGTMRDTLFGAAARSALASCIPCRNEKCRSVWKDPVRQVVREPDRRDQEALCAGHACRIGQKADREYVIMRHDYCTEKEGRQKGGRAGGSYLPQTILPWAREACAAPGYADHVQGNGAVRAGTRSASPDARLFLHDGSVASLS